MELKDLFLVSFSMTMLVGVFNGSMVTTMISHYALPGAWIGYLYGISAASNILGGYVHDLFLKKRSPKFTKWANTSIAAAAVVSTAILLLDFQFLVALAMLCLTSVFSTHTSIWTGTRMMHACPPSKRATWSSTSVMVSRMCMFFGSALSPLLAFKGVVLALSLLCIGVIFHVMMRMRPETA